MASIRSGDVLHRQRIFFKSRECSSKLNVLLFTIVIYFFAYLFTFISQFFFTSFLFKKKFFAPFALLYDRVCWSPSPLHYRSYTELCGQSILEGFPHCRRVCMYAYYFSILLFFLPFFLLSFRTFMTFHALFSLSFFPSISISFFFLNVYLVFL